MINSSKERAAALPRASGLIGRLESQLGETGLLLLFLLPSLALVGFAQIYPLADSAVISFFDWTLARSPTIGPFVGFGNYSKVLADPTFVGSATYTVIFAVSSTALQLIFGLAISLLMVGEAYWLKFARTLVMLPMVIAPVAIGTVWRMIMSARVGPLNRLLAAVGIDGPNWLGDPNWARISLILIDAWEWTPFVVIVLTAALMSLPTDLLRAASVDGAGRWTIFRHVVLPLILPVLMLVALFRLIDGLLTLDIVVTTTSGGPGFATNTLSFWIYQQGLRYFNISYAAAASWLLLIACVLVAAGMLIWRRRLMIWQTAARS
jgi:multiple sugar transport system permease protein